MKNGKINGFNFNEHKNEKIGILRHWNKHHKDKRDAADNDDPDSSNKKTVGAIRGRKKGTVKNKLI